MSFSPDRKVAGAFFSILAAGSLFTSAFASPDRVQSLKNTPNLDAFPLCRAGKKQYYPSGLNLEIPAKPVIYLRYIAAKGNSAEIPVLSISGDGYRYSEMAMHRSKNGRKRHFDLTLDITETANPDTLVRFAINDSAGKTLVETESLPPVCD